MMEDSANPRRADNRPEGQPLDGIHRRASLKREFGLLQAAIERGWADDGLVPRSKSVMGTPQPSHRVFSSDELADALLLAYVGLRGYLAAPEKIDLGSVIAKIAETLSETGMLLNWLPWTGGDCPLPASVEVEIMWSDGGKQTANAGDIAWAVPQQPGLVTLAKELRFVMFYRVVRWA